MMERNEHLLNLRVLYVEDDKDTREEMTTLLRRRIGKLFTASDGKEGLALFLEHHPDILILDLLMPVMGGMDLARQIRQSDEDCHIIITSTVNEVNSILHMVDLGIDKYIIKPVDVNELMRELNAIAEKICHKSNGNLPIEISKKKKIEDEIKRLFAAFLKSDTGKGPKDINVFIQADIIDIHAYDTLTIMERNMIDNGNNYAIIEQNRKIFYSIKEQQICDLLMISTGRRAEIQNVVVDLERGVDKLRLRII